MPPRWRRGARRLAGVPRARRLHRDRHVPRGVRHVGGVLPEGGGNPRGGQAGRPGIPRFPAVALEAPAYHQCPGADQPRDKAQVEGSAGASLDDIAGASGRRGHVRAGRDAAGVEVLLEGKDGRALRRESHARDRREGQLDAAGGRGQEDDRIGSRACGQDRGGIGYQPCSRFQDAEPTRFGSGATPTFSTLPSSEKLPVECAFSNCSSFFIISWP